MERRKLKRSKKINLTDRTHGCLKTVKYSLTLAKRSRNVKHVDGEFAGLDPLRIYFHKSVFKGFEEVSKPAAKTLIIGPAVVRHAEPFHALTTYNLHRGTEWGQNIKSTKHVLSIMGNKPIRGKESGGTNNRKYEMFSSGAI